MSLEDLVENTPKKTAYEFSIAGFRVKLNNTMIAMAVPIASAIGGAMWGAFEFYNDYMDMKAKIQKYVAPDLSAFDKRLAVIEENSAKTTDYTRDIKNDLKDDIRRTETVAEQIERSVKQAQRETDAEMRAMRRDVKEDLDKARNEVDRVKRDTESRLDRLTREIDSKIQKALDNPLANK